MANITLPGAKAQAKLLKQRLGELGVSIKQTHAHEAVAAIHNFPDWNRFKAHVDSAPAKPERGHLKETKIFIAPPGHGKSATMETLFTHYALEGEGSNPMRCHIPETPIAKMLGLGRWGHKDRESFNIR